MEGQSVPLGVPADPSGPIGLDTTVPNVARMYSYLLGGTDHFQADRAMAERLLKLVPDARLVARENREFLRRSVVYLAGQGVAQFLDIGAGMPTGDLATHEIARKVNPDARVSYVDYDPIVVSHGKAMLARPGETVVERADLRQPEGLLSLPGLNAHLDFRRPVAVILTAVLHFISDREDPARILSVIREALGSGSYLVIVHATADDVPDPLKASVLSTFRNSSAPIWPRSASQIRRLFDGFDLVEPGLVPQHSWRPADGEKFSPERAISLGGVARKP
jgi:hypothetical protein